MPSTSRKRVLVIGAGPAGMMSAIAAADSGAQVIVLERNAKVGRKLSITGKGRCNVTNIAPMEDFQKSILSNPKFCYSAFASWTNQDMMHFLESMGVPLKEERGGRIFPTSDKSYDVVDALYRAMKQHGVQIVNNMRVTDVSRRVDGTALVWRVEGGGKRFEGDVVILATGGKSYSLTGSTGDGHAFAQSLGHSIVPLRPGLSALVCGETWPTTLTGLSLINVRVTMTDDAFPNKAVYSDIGEMLFTHFGVSGPLILRASSFMQAHMARRHKTWGETRWTLHIDVKPGLTEEKLDARVQRDLTENHLQNMKNALRQLLPERLIMSVLMQAGIPFETKASELTAAERKALVAALKDLTITILQPRPLDEALVTMGGVNVKEIDPRTCQSTLQPGLFFAGELIDVDALTGGFNLQVAFSTGYLAGKSAATCEIQGEQVCLQ